MKMSNEIRRSVKSSKLEVIALSNTVNSLGQMPNLTSVRAEGSSFEQQSQHVSAFLQESNGKEHYKFQNTTMESNEISSCQHVILHDIKED